MKIIKALPMMIHKLTPMQTVYTSLLRDPQKSLIVCTGPAGTGKTSVVCRHAMEQLKERNIERLVIMCKSNDIQQWLQVFLVDPVLQYIMNRFFAYFIIALVTFGAILLFVIFCFISGINGVVQCFI